MEEWFIIFLSLAFVQESQSWFLSLKEPDSLRVSGGHWIIWIHGRMKMKLIESGKTAQNSDFFCPWQVRTDNYQGDYPQDATWRNRKFPKLLGVETLVLSKAWRYSGKNVLRFKKSVSTFGDSLQYFPSLALSWCPDDELWPVGHRGGAGAEPLTPGYRDSSRWGNQTNEHAIRLRLMTFLSRLITVFTTVWMIGDAALSPGIKVVKINVFQNSMSVTVLRQGRMLYLPNF